MQAIIIEPDLLVGNYLRDILMQKGFSGVKVFKDSSTGETLKNNGDFQFLFVNERTVNQEWLKTFKRNTCFNGQIVLMALLNTDNVGIKKTREDADYILFTPFIKADVRKCLNYFKPEAIGL